MYLFSSFVALFIECFLQEQILLKVLVSIESIECFCKKSVNDLQIIPDGYKPNALSNFKCKDSSDDI